MPGSHDPASPQARADGYYLGSEARYSYLRRDLTLLVRHAACEVMQHFPGTTPLGLSDLSQADGLTPGMDMGRARHPESTHRGNDLDVAYFQTDGANNPQIICGDGSDRNGNGSPGRFNNGYYCTTDDNIVDLEREAYFLAMMSRSDLVRVFGVDWKLPMSLQRSIGALRSSGAITAAEAARAQRLGYCRSAECPSGWSFHHHHTHLSYCPVGMPDC